MSNKQIFIFSINMAGEITMMKPGSNVIRLGWWDYLKTIWDIYRNGINPVMTKEDKTSFTLQIDGWKPKKKKA